MPVKLDAPSFSRKDACAIDPAEIVVDPALNARSGGLDMDHVRKLAYSFLNEGGQSVPVQIRREAGKPKLVAGYHRHAAAVLVNTELQPANPIKLLCVFREQNEEEAYRDSIVENRRARRTNAIDDAHNQRRLRDVYGWDEKRIAALYDTSPAKLHETARLLELPAPVQRKIAAKDLPVSGALALVEMPPAEREAALAGATNGDGKVRGETIRTKVREKKREAGKKQARSYAEVKAYFEAVRVQATGMAIGSFCKTFGQFCEGAVGEEAMSGALRRLAGN
jgi:ParB/RepB/Spo0J family partition protein